MDQRHERVLVETQRHRIEGTLTIANDGYRSRVSDLLNAPDRDFIALTEVTIELLDAEGAGGPGSQHDFISVSRRHIVFAIPLGEAAQPSTPVAPTEVRTSA